MLPRTQMYVCMYACPHVRVDCEAGQCPNGLMCGINNCHSFHAIDASTGLDSSADCCEALTKCPRGQKFIAASGVDLAKCEDCADGKFNAAYDDSDTCAEHKVCPDGQAATRAGDARRDTLCPGMYVCMYVCACVCVCVTRNAHLPANSIHAQNCCATCVYM